MAGEWSFCRWLDFEDKIKIFFGNVVGYRK
jgi:hypothetical protein